MGHTRLGELPRTRRWDQVVELLTGGGSPEEIAAASLAAADRGFREAAEEAGVAHVVWLLTQLPLAAQDPGYVRRLADLGIELSGPPGVVELASAFTDAVDAHMRQIGDRSDLTEMAEMAAAETLTATLGPRTQTLFGTSSEDTRRELAALAATSRFADLARRFFASLTRRYLTFFLSRELANHVGGDRRFANIEEHRRFDRGFHDALDLHCRQASRLVEDFAGGWFSKANWEQKLTPETTKNFVAVALKKIRSEINRGGRPRP